MKTSQVLTITAGTLLAAGVGYAVYFDHKRRHDPKFRKQLKKDSKRTSKAAKRQKQVEQKRIEEAVEAVVKELQQPGTFPTGPQDREKFFMDQVTTGETLIALGPANYIAAATAFFKAIKMYPAPVELIMIYQKATPEEVFDIIMRMVGKDAQLGGATDKNQAASSLAALGVMGAVPKQGSANLDEVDDEAAPTAPSSQASSQEWDTLSGASLGPSIGGAAPATSSAAPFDGPSSTADVATTEAALEMQNSSTPASIDPSGVTDATETPAATVISESTPFDFSAGGSYAPSPLFKKASPAASASQEQPKADSKPEVRHADEVSKETGA